MTAKIQILPAAEFYSILVNISRVCWRTVRVALVLAVGCISWIEPARGEFRKIPVTSVKFCKLQLAGAKGIPHTCRRYRDANAKLPVWETALGFEFGQLTYSQWQQLVKSYATWHNRRNLAAYDRDRNYSLIDFMPPMIQSLNRHRFQAQDLGPLPHQPHTPQVSLSRTKLVANCWGTLYEILRLAKQVNPAAPILFMTDSHSMLDTLRQHSSQLKTNTQAGDIVLIYHQNNGQTYLDHAALMVDQHIFFEKAGSGSHVPYRLIDRSTLEQIWNTNIYTFEYRRPHTQYQWQSPEQVFGPIKPRTREWTRSSDEIPPLSQQDTQTSIGPTLQFVVQQLPAFVLLHGRFHLSPRAYDPKLLLEQQ